MKTRREIASTILNRRNSTSPFVMTQELQSALGPQGYSEALRLSWLVPNLDSGGIQISELRSKLDEMMNVANSDKPQIGDQATISVQGQAYVGTVATVNPDGTVGLSFESNAQPPSGKQAYAPNEVQVTKTGPAPQAAQPAPPSAGPSMVRYPTGGPEGPGIGR